MKKLYLALLFVSSLFGQLKITTTDIPNGIVSTSYTTTFNATGGNTPYTWSVASGTLPAGLSLATTGILSGTPTSFGWSGLFTIQVTDNTSTTTTLPYSMLVTPVLDIYGGIVGKPCTPTGYYHTVKVGNRWWFCSPSGNLYWATALGGASTSRSGTTYDNTAIAKYGDLSVNWGAQQTKRIMSWGFNTVGQQSSDYMGINSMNTHILPTASTLLVANYAAQNLFGYGTHPIKDIAWGLNSNFHFNFNAPNMDFFDASFGTWTNNYFATFTEDPLRLFQLIDDTDFAYGFGAGPDFATLGPGFNTTHIGYEALITSPVQFYNLNLAGQYGFFAYTDSKVYTKTAMASPPTTCSVTTPCSLRDFLSKKYSATISSLNTAWGSNYTTFDSSGTSRTQTICTGVVWDGTLNTCTDTISNLNISPLSGVLSIDSSPIAYDCPWFKGGCGVSTSNLGVFVAPPGGVINGGLQPYISSNNIQPVPCAIAGCTTNQQDYSVIVVYHTLPGYTSAMSPQAGLWIPMGDKLKVISPTADATTLTKISGYDIYSFCMNNPSGPQMSWCKPWEGGTFVHDEVLQASNIPIGTDWTAPDSGLITGTGNLPAPINTIEYTTGTVSLNFSTPPTAGSHTITFAYTQNGWMYGTGLMDEDGRNTTWTGTNPVCLTAAYICDGDPAKGGYAVPNANATLGADIDLFLAQYAATYFKQASTGFKNNLPNTLYFGADTTGTWGVPPRKEILQGAAPYVDGLFTSWAVDQPSPTIAMNAYRYYSQYAGDKPIVNFLTREATNDSALYQYGDPSDTTTQKSRGQQYQSWMSTMLSATNYQGSISWVGSSWWGLTDFGGQEFTNWGLLSINDNPYDGKSACSTTRTDPWGFSTGGEAVVPSWASSGFHTAQPSSTGLIQVPISGTIYLFAATNSGISAASPPTWPIVSNTTVVDGSITWRNIGTKNSTSLCFGNSIDYIKSANAQWWLPTQTGVGIMGNKAIIGNKVTLQ